MRSPTAVMACAIASPANIDYEALKLRSSLLPFPPGMQQAFAKGLSDSLEEIDQVRMINALAGGADKAMIRLRGRITEKGLDPQNIAAKLDAAWQRHARSYARAWHCVDFDRSTMLLKFLV